ELVAGLAGREGSEPVRGRPDALQLGRELLVLGSEAFGHVGAGSPAPLPTAAPEGAQGVEDRGDVDPLLDDRTRDGSEKTERPEEHEPERETHPEEDALKGDPA